MTTTWRQQEKEPWLSLDSAYDTIAPTTIFFNNKKSKTLSILTKKNSKERKKEMTKERE